MAVSLPISGPARWPAARTAAAPTQLGATAPSVALPLAFILTGLAALCAVTIWLFLHPELLAAYHYNQYVIALTHLFVLGWILSIIIGAMYQLVPVALEVRLHSEPLAWWHFVFHVAGFIGMVWMFRVWNLKQVGHFGSVLTLGIGLFLYNMARTLRRVPRWQVTASAVTAGLCWIALAVTAGLLLAIAKCSYDTTEGLATAGGVRILIGGLRAIAGFMSRFDAISAMHAHAHLGGVGLFTMLLVGVSYKLIPMFTLSEIQSTRRAAWSIGLLNAGLAGSFLTILMRSPLKPLFALLLIGALGLYLCELAAILRVRKRRKLDWGIKYFLTAIGLLIITAGLAMVLSWPALPLTPFTGQLENLYGFLGLMGVVSLAIMGVLYKIIPFLVWFARYSSQIGRTQVPSLADLYSPLLQAAGYWAMVGGMALTSLAILLANRLIVRLGCGLLALAVTTLIINVGCMLSHLFKPHAKPLVLGQSSANAKVL